MKDWGKEFSISYFQHFVVRRNVYNPFEAKNVKQIVNYIDIGTQIKVNAEGHPEIAVAGSWQINKNHMLKGKVDNKRLSLAYIFKSWFHPSVSVAVSGKYDYAKMKPDLGVVINLESPYWLIYALLCV